jgi:hypothetical protein
MTSMASSSIHSTSTELRFWAVQILFGSLVLASYVHGLAAYPGSDALYGTMPAWLASVYGVTMISAAIAYFPMMFGLRSLRALPSEPVAAGAGFVDGVLLLLLAPSVVWMPVTFAFLDDGSTSTALYVLMRAVLLASTCSRLT